MIVPVVLGRKAKDGTVHLLAEPDHGLRYAPGAPLHGPQEPGRGDPGEFRPCRPIKVKRCVGVTLEIRSGHIRMDFPFHSPSYDSSLVLPRREESDLPGIHDGGHTHGDGFEGDVLFAEEVGGGRFSIAGGEPGMKVSWQVSGTRHDRYAQEHPIAVEALKPEYASGRYMYPDLYGAPKEEAIGRTGVDDAKHR